MIKTLQEEKDQANVALLRKRIAEKEEKDQANVDLLRKRISEYDITPTLQSAENWLSPREMDGVISTVETYAKYAPVNQSVYNELISSLKQRKKLYSSFKSAEEFAAADVNEINFRQRHDGYTNADVQSAIDRLTTASKLAGIEGETDEVKWLKNYGMNIGYSDTESYAQEIAAAQTQIQEIDKRIAEINKIDVTNTEGGMEKIAYWDNEIEKLKGQKKELENNISYFKGKSTEVRVTQQADFNEKAVVNNKIYDALYRFANNIPNAGTSIQAQATSNDVKLYNGLEEKEKKVYLYLANAEGIEAARQYFEYMRPTLNERQNAAQTKKNKEFSDEHPVLANLATLGTQLIDGTIGAPVKLIGSLTGDYEKNWASYDSLTTFTNTIRTDTAQDLSNFFGTEWAGFVYNTVMSIADMGTALAVGGAVGKIAGVASSAANTTNIAKGVTQFIMSSEAASQTMTDARQRGLSGIQIAALGVASGTIEALTEKLPLDNLFGAKPNYIKSVVKQIATEGTEEAISNVANTILDEIIAGNQSALKQQIGDLMASGMSYQDAANKVLIDKVKEIGMDALAGALSGAVMGGGSVALNKLSTVHFSIPTKYKGDLSSAQTWVADKFQNLKNSTNKKGLGTVVVDPQTMTDAIHKTETADQALTFAAINDIIHKGKVQLDGNAAAIGTVATLNGNTHSVVLTASKMNNGNFLITGIALDGDAVVYDARDYLQQMAESATEQSTEEQGEISTKLVDGQDGGFDYDSLNRITQTSGQQAPVSAAAPTVPAAQGNIAATDNGVANQTPAFGKQKSIAMESNAEDFDGEETTGIDVEDKSDYPYNMQTVIQEYIDSTNDEILEYAEECRNNKQTPHKRVPIGPVSSRQINDAQNLLGIDFSGYINALDNSALNHIEKRHGISGEKDSCMKDLRDVARVGYILNEYDNVEVTTDADGNVDYSKQFRDKDNNPAPMLKFSKKINGTYYAVIACPDARYKKLWLVSAYIGEKNSSSVTQESNVETLDSTPEAGLASPETTNNRLSQEKPIVNTYDMQNESENSNPDVLESRSYDYTESKENWRAENRNEGSTSEVESLDSIISGIEETFGVPINKGNIRQKKAAGIFKTKVNAIRTQLGNALPTICHELGHYFDLKHKLTRLGAIGEAVEVMQKTNPEFSKLYGENQQKGEAVAEFIREYLRDRMEAKQKYPKFFVEVTNALGEDLGKLNAISDKVNAYMYASLSEQIAVGITNRTNARRKKGGVGNRMKTVIDKVVKRMYDDVIAIRDVSEKAYKGVYDSRKAATVVNEIIFEGMRDVDGNFVEGFESESLSKILEPINNIQSKGRFKQLCESLVGRHENSMDEFNTYLALKRGLDLAPRGIPIFRNGNPAMQDVSEIQQMIDQMEAEYPQFKGVAEQLYAWQKALGQTYYVNTGMMSQTDFDAMWKNNPHYVPFNRNVKQEIVKGSSTKFGKQNSEIKRIKGGSEELFDAIENIVLRSALMVQNAKNNRVMQILALDIEKGLIDSSIMEKISDTKAGAINAALEQKSNALKSDDQADGDFDDIDLVEWTGNAASENIVWATINGQRVLYEVHDTELLKALLNSTPHQADILTQVVGKVNSAFKMMTTGGNLIWSVCSNSFRDFATGYYYGSEGNFLKYTRDYFAAARDVIGNRQSYQEAKGAGLGYTSRVASPKTLSRIMLKLGQNQEGRRALTNAFNSIIEGIQSVSEVVEATPRLAEYKRAIAQGKSKTDAVYAASEVTLNFDRKGDIAKKLDLVLPFFNVQMQGLYKQAQMIADPTTRMQFIRRKVVSSFVMAAFVIAANAVLGGKDEYEKLSDYVKNNYYCFYIGNGKFIKIPKARELDVLESALERMAETICYNNEFSDSFNGFAEYVFQAYAPLGFPDITALFGEKDRLTGFLEPFFTDWLLVGSIAELAYNKNYAGSPIVPTQYQDLVAKEQYDNKTSGVAKLLGRIFNMSPMQIDHLMVSNTGFVGKLLKAWTAEDFDWTGGYGNQFTADTAYSNDVTEQFYDELDEAEMYAKTYPENAEYQARYQQYSSVGSVVSYFYKQAKADPENAREYRILAVAYAEEFLGDGEAQNEKLNSLYEQTRESGIYPYRKFQPSYSQKKKDSNGEYVRDEYDNVTSEEVTMTPQEFLEYINTYNETIDVVYEEIMNGITEPKLSAKALAKAKDHIDDYARSGMMPDVMVAREAGISAADYYLITLGSSTNGSPGVNQDEAKVALSKSSLTKKQKSIMWDLMFPTARYNPYGKRYY